MSDKRIFGLKSAQNETDPGASVPEGWGRQDFRPIESKKRQDVPAWIAVVVILLLAFGLLGLFLRDSLLSSVFGSVFFVVAMLSMGAVGIFIYLLPAIVAFNRKHPSKTAILVCDLLFGWTFLGWGIALVC